MTYRPDIDGLRAIAVLPVLLFHAKLGFTGGYVGVDVFFVISGYLITSLILADLRQDRFSFLTFWERRVRRILPALAVMIVATVALAWPIMLPDDFKELSAFVAAQAVLGANFLSWARTGYFGGTAETKPLLHLWSLAIEEQFYLLLPIVVALVWRRRPRAVGPVLAAFAVATFGVSVFLTHLDRGASYFLMPSRAWELLAGSLLCFVPAPATSRRWLSETAAVIGLAAIAVSAWTYSPSTRFPGVAALVPCLGTVALIWSGADPRNLVGRLLAWAPFRGIGLISYSLYLWHWPLLALARYYALERPEPVVRAAVLGVSVVAAIASYFFVELPFRHRRVFATRRSVLLAGAGCLATMIAASLTVIGLGGLPGRFPPQVVAYANGIGDTEFLWDQGRGDIERDDLFEIVPEYRSQPVHLLVWGDSHAKSIVPMIRTLCREHGKRGVAATCASTAPVLDYVSDNPYSLREQAPAYNRAVVEYVERNRVPNVLLAAFWGTYPVAFDPANPNADEIQCPLDEGLMKTVQQLQAAGARVWIMRQIPTYMANVPQVLAIAALKGEPPHQVDHPLQWHRDWLVRHDALFDTLETKGVVSLDPVDLLLDNESYCRNESDGHSLYSDAYHLSIRGAEYIRPLFEPIFEEPAVAEGSRSGARQATAITN